MAHDHDAVLELRRYTLHPGRRDELIDVFNRELLETQAAVGIRVPGQFRDLDHPDRFVWLRSFRDMASRPQALGAFYDGPAWAAHRDAANATMIDSDDVLLLRPARPGSGFQAAGLSPHGARSTPSGSLVVATIYSLWQPEDTFVDFFYETVSPVMTTTLGTPIAGFVTETSANNFPALPVRDGEQVFVWFARFASVEEHRRHRSLLDGTPDWTARVRPALAERLTASAEHMRLAPTERSALR